MSRIKKLTLNSFIDYVERRPASLGCWRDGTDGLYSMLAWLNTRPLAEQGELAAEVGFQAAAFMLTAQHHNQVGVASGWTSIYMRQPARRQRTSDLDRVAMFKTAGSYWVLQNALTEVRVGVRAFEASGTHVRLAYQGNNEVDALDRLLDLVENLESVGKARTRPDPRLREWISRDGLSTPWKLSPTWVKDVFKKLAGEVLDTYRRYLPDTAKLGIVSMSDLDVFWTEFTAWGMYMHGVMMHGSMHLPTVLPRIPRIQLIREFSENTQLSMAVTERIVDQLTLDLSRCSDGALTPFFAIEDELIPMSSLILPTSPQRNFLAIAQLDPSMVGEAGRLLGVAGERAVQSVLQRLEGALVVSRIKAFRDDGSLAGDLDIVVCDPIARTVVVLEIKWGIAADGNAEVYRVEQGAIEKRKQVLRLRNELHSGRVVPQWPRSWPDTAGFNFRWYILTRDVLAMRQISDDEVTIRSYQLLNRMLRPGSTVADLTSLLDSPPMPPERLSQTQWEKLRYGDIQVEIEHLFP